MTYLSVSQVCLFLDDDIGLRYATVVCVASVMLASVAVVIAGSFLQETPRRGGIG